MHPVRFDLYHGPMCVSVRDLPRLERRVDKQNGRREQIVVTDLSEREESERDGNV